MAQTVVLVVDDDAAVLKVVVDMLNNGGYVTIAAADGRTAFELFRSRESEIHLLVTDVDMPNMSGIELSQAVLSEHPNVRVLLISGKPMPAERTRLPFLAKPFTPEQLYHAVAAVLTQPPPTFADAVIRRPCERCDERGPRARTA